MFNTASMQEIVERIKKKLGNGDFYEQITNGLSGTEFNSILLDIFDRRASRISNQALLASFEKNRFTGFAKNNAIKAREMELDWLKQADANGFNVVSLSPVAPLGTCSAMATVSQHKVLSSVRGTEVVADATNVLALQIASELKHTGDKNKIVKYATVHRHIRAQYFDNPNYSAHFAAFCMVTGGYDRGNYDFEMEQLEQHIKILLELIKKEFPANDISIKFFLKQSDSIFPERLGKQEYCWSKLPYQFAYDTDNKYYQMLQFKIYLHVGGDIIDIADGGFVDWIQNLTGNRKLRCMISGAGLELVQKLKQ